MLVASDAIVGVFVPSAVARSIGSDMVCATAEHDTASLPFVMEWGEWPGVAVKVTRMKAE